MKTFLVEKFAKQKHKKIIKNDNLSEKNIVK